VNSAFVRVTALVLAALFLIAASLAALEVWRDGDFLANPKLKITAAWLTSGAVFLAIGMRRRRASK
jgi:hypothetical protein